MKNWFSTNFCIHFIAEAKTVRSRERYYPKVCIQRKILKKNRQVMGDKLLHEVEGKKSTSAYHRDRLWKIKWTADWSSQKGRRSRCALKKLKATRLGCEEISSEKKERDSSE